METIRCPQCGKKLGELRKGNGYAIKCPRCGNACKG